MARSFAQTNPECYIEVKKNRMTHRYYSPEIVRMILREARERILLPIRKPLEDISQPQGWKRKAELVKELDISRQTLSRIVNIYKESHPEWFRYTSKSGREIYSPELIAIVVAEIEKKQLLLVAAEPGWVSVDALAKQLHLGYSTLVQLAEPYKKEHPEYFKVCLSQKGEGKPGIRLSPELTFSIIQQVESQRNSNTSDITSDEANTYLRNLIEGNFNYC